VRAILRRLEPWITVERPLRVLDVGAAQGRSLIVLARMGHKAAGVEPYEGAVEIARELAAGEGVDIDIRVGAAEQIPFPDASFDVVLATSVMEHVTDLERSLAEVRRVLVPGGLFWFNSASALSPRQQEIRRFPLFPWYPGALKRRIMLWAVRRRPNLVGYTEAPALHWWTPRSARRRLVAAGFAEVVDRWRLRHPDEMGSALQRRLIEMCRRNSAARLLGDVLVPNCSYMARVEGAMPDVA
jgi:SAM-dependent methyltransferase